MSHPEPDDFGDQWENSERDLIAGLPSWLRAQCCDPDEPWVSRRVPDRTMEPGGHDHGHTGCYFFNLAADEIERLHAWRVAAMIALSDWDDVWEAAGRPGRLGSSKAASVRRTRRKARIMR